LRYMYLGAYYDRAGMLHSGGAQCMFQNSDC
jgi:hypothetical protein